MRGREVRLSTGCRSRKQALKVEARIRDQISLGNWGIIEREAAPTVAEFIRDQFIPWVKISYQNSNTRANYLFGAKQLLQSSMATVPLDKITSEHTTRYAADHAEWTPAGINQALRTLRRALSLALEWGRIAAKPKVKTMRENRRDRVLTYDEEDAYLSKCPELWRTMAVIMLDCGCRPDEVMRLRWDDLDWRRGTLQVHHGKSKAARRTLTMSDRVMEALEPLRKESGPVWPSRSKTGHISQSKLWNDHRDALATSKLQPFEPYSLRHTCLTRLGEFVPLPTLMVIAGHTNISMTMRYVHPAQSSVEQAFAESESRHKNRHRAKFVLTRKSDKAK